MSLFIGLFCIWVGYKVIFSPDSKSETVDIDDIHRKHGVGATIKAMDEKFIQNSKTIISGLKEVYKESPRQTFGEMYVEFCQGILKLILWLIGIAFFIWFLLYGFVQFMHGMGV